MFRTISVQQLEYLLDGERTFTLLDVREQREYEAGHLLGAVNLPYERLDEVEAEIPKDRPVVIYCAYGGQSLLAARELAGRGSASITGDRSQAGQRRPVFERLHSVMPSFRQMP